MSLSIVFLLSSITSTRLESSKLIKRFAPRIITSAERKILIMNQNESGKDVTRLEITGHIVVTNVPAIILLKDTISDYIAEPFDECVQA